MAEHSKIEWTDATWNPVTGCTKVSSGCKRCYAERIAERFRGTKNHPFEQGFDLTLQPQRLDQPRRWKKPRLIFVNSMSDLFHEDLADAYIHRVFDVMAEANHHTYQVLTKRANRLMLFVNDRFLDRGCPPHIWVGVSVEDSRNTHRLDFLKLTKAAVRFVSFEPLLSPMGAVNLSGIHWAIVGGESGPGARPMEPAWARSLRDLCVREEVPFFFKQWGGRTPKAGGDALDGMRWQQNPHHPRRPPEPV